MNLEELAKNLDFFKHFRDMVVKLDYLIDILEKQNTKGEC